MQKQIRTYIISYLSPYFCGYRKDFNSQQALPSLVKNWKKVLDEKGSLKHDRLLAKLCAYGFNETC